MGWRQITSAREALSLPRGTSVMYFVGGEEHRGTIRDYQVGGLVYFQPDLPDSQNRFSGWIDPKKLKAKS